MRRSRNARLKKLFYPTPRVALGWVMAAASVYLALVVVKFLIHQSGFFLIEQIKVSGNYYLEEKNIQESAKLDLNQTMFSVNLANINNELLTNEYIRGVSVSRVLPSTILIDVQERKPVLYLVDKTIYMVDETGKMLPKLPRMPMGKLPIVTGLSGEDIQRDSTLLLKQIALVKKIREVDDSLIPFISEINLQKDGTPVLILIKGAARVHLGKSHHYQRLFLLSQLLSKQPVIDKLPSIKSINLTFVNRIIVQNKG